MGTHEFRLPDLGEGLTEADLVSWSVQVGDVVTLNQPLGEVETAKAQVELPSPFAGTVAELLAQPGDTVAVGAPLVRFGVAADGGGGVIEPEPAARTSVLVGYGPEAAAPVSRRRRPDAKPSARRRARELGIDLAEVLPTGASAATGEVAGASAATGEVTGGVITVADVERASRAPGADVERATRAPVTDVVRGTRGPVVDVGRDTRVPVAGVRKRTAAAMAASAAIPQVTEFVTVDVTESMRMLGRLGLSSPLPLVARAVVAALAEQPSLNSSWDEENHEIVTHGRVNLGIAVATARGLLVPTVKNAQTLSLRELATAITGAAELARSGRAAPADLTGGTFSITNIGVYGIDSGTPMVNPGEAAILCLGAVAERPWVVEHQLAVRSVTTLGLSFDHRLVDGEQASRFLADVAAMLCDPAQLLARL
ncbi:MAG TPA: dihydrolipoamide acetyltransferase family protein [Aldersonia sp.]